MILLLLYILFMSAATFAVFGLDKWKAVHGRWRISERTLILLAVSGGSPGALAGMCFFRHKTRKPLFFAGVPLILAAQAFCLIFLVMLSGAWQY